MDHIAPCEGAAQEIRELKGRWWYACLCFALRRSRCGKPPTSEELSPPIPYRTMPPYRQHAQQQGDGAERCFSAQLPRSYGLRGRLGCPSRGPMHPLLNSARDQAPSTPSAGAPHQLCPSQAVRGALSCHSDRRPRRPLRAEIFCISVTSKRSSHARWLRPGTKVMGSADIVKYWMRTLLGFVHTTTVEPCHPRKAQRQRDEGAVILTELAEYCS